MSFKSEGEIRHSQTTQTERVITTRPALELDILKRVLQGGNERT